jgi:hypothetical protein
MELPTHSRVFEAVAKLRRELQLEVEALAKRRSALEIKLEALDKDLKLKRRQLELVEATEGQLTAQGLGQRVFEGEGPGASTQVRGSAMAKLQPDICVC